MFLKGIKDKFKYKSAVKFLKQELEKPREGVKRDKGVESIACIVDLDKFEDTNAIFDLVEDFSLRPSAVKIIGYKSFYDKNSPYATPVFSDKDLGWNGDIENSYALEFLSREYDVLINYYTEENLMLQLMSIKTKARINVGFGDIDKKFNDLILNTQITDFKTFKNELKKYLLILNEIKE
ncbi:DUF6913 domain-containing protein [Spongiimicrobium salis]|uniref:DUF6913 domain-containing protein n=1 Tax=Spongiimicrobium salis TaxID=1667022 RepID=UPI00374CA8DE